ncbi:hypothetical protein NKR23_g4940 [Pleurostoma richardsiae]|uniref:Cytochrome c oxidase assembly protein COX20, mitochondrial n=1 Tax=Pleurostoma richardsiae TaxID=41990 RepID=A0AA38RH33_9PEZI|nr:hypothetical protein NKR23_g4940 [Pleurostoma richardsiae]
MSRPPQDGTKTWDAQTFDSAPPEEQLRRIREEEQSRRATDATVQGRASVSEAAKSIKPADFLQIHQAPCVREGLIAGIGGGSAVGVLRYVLGAPVPKAANWAVGTWAVASILSYEFCQARRRAEREKMKRVVEVYDRKQAESKQKEDERRRQKQLEEEAAARIASQKRWYKFW